MPQTWGVPVEEIVRGIRHGVRKVNIDTDCRLAMTAAFRKVAVQSKSEFDPRKFLKPAMDGCVISAASVRAVRHRRPRLGDQVIPLPRWPSATARRARSTRGRDHASHPSPVSEFARIEFAFALHRHPCGTLRSSPAAIVSILTLRTPMPDAADDFLDRHPPGLWHLAAECIERVCSGCGTDDEPCITRCVLGAGDGFPPPPASPECRRPACARIYTRRARYHRNRQRIDPGGANEIDGLIRIGQQLIVADLAFDAMAVFLFTAAMLERAEHAQLTFHRAPIQCAMSTTRRVMSTLYS